MPAAFQFVPHSVLCSYIPLLFFTEQQFRFPLLCKARHLIGALGSLPVKLLIMRKKFKILH